MTPEDEAAAALARSEAARILGSIKTPKQAAASRANLAAAHARHQPKRCTCGRLPHTARCAVGRRERYAARQKEKKGKG